ncbi:cyclase family protein [Streptomyces sp. NPDC005492]|uniref:cyclase family protein n=1 Tax=Streptomyces sp. NPDC005492 TaxID=3156883 RepID=UPI0033B5E457
MTTFAVTGTPIDLTHPLTPGTPHVPSQPGFEAHRIREVPAALSTVTAFSLCTHTGTHIDAPFHALADGKRITDYPPDFFAAPAVGIGVAKERGEEITAADLDAAALGPGPGDVLCLATGWQAHHGSPVYHDHPHLAPSAADWIVEHRVRILVLDTLTPEPPVQRRGADFALDIHRRILGADIPIVENAANLDQLAGLRGHVLIAPMPITGADGAPCRVFGWFDGTSDADAESTDSKT